MALAGWVAAWGSSMNFCKTWTWSIIRASGQSQWLVRCCGGVVSKGLPPIQHISDGRRKLSGISNAASSRVKVNVNIALERPGGRGIPSAAGLCVHYGELFELRAAGGLSGAYRGRYTLDSRCCFDIDTGKIIRY